MRLYRRKDNGKFVGLQSQAGKDFEIIDVPDTGRDNLATFLNDLTATAPTPAVTVELAPPEPEATGNCPRCRWDHKRAARYAERVKENMTAEGVIGFIDEAGADALGRVTTAVIHRLAAMKEEN